MTEEHVTDLVKRVPGLTPRQAEAARKLLNQGLTLREIARRLGYSRESVSRAIKKLASGGDLLLITPDNPYTSCGCDYTDALKKGPEGLPYARLRATYDSRCKVMEEELARCADLVMLTNVNARVQIDAWTQACAELGIEPSPRSMKAEVLSLRARRTGCGNKICQCIHE